MIILKNLYIRLLDWVSYKLDVAACKALEESRKKKMGPSPKTAQGRADAPHAIGNCLCASCLQKREEQFKPGTVIFYSETVITPERLADLANEKYDIRITPDRPDPYLSKVRKEVNQLTGSSVAHNYPEGS